MTAFKNTPIRRKLMVIILLTSVIVMLLMRGAFFTYELLAFRKTTMRQLSTLGEVIAANSTAALAFDNQDDARETLSALEAERHVTAAGLYDRHGKLFAKYPADRLAAAFPAAPGNDGYHFGDSYLAGFQPVVQKDRRLGTLYLQFDTKSVMDEWLWGSLGIAGVVMAIIILVVYALSRTLQKQISLPILALADTARAISERRDYSVRATKLGGDELGLLTDAFNQMLTEIQKLNQELEQRVVQRTAQLEAANQELEAFSYSVSHDLRAPLRHVDGFVGLLDKHAAASLDEKGRRYLTVISDAARQMGRLIDDLLAFARAGRTSMHVVGIDHDALVDGVIREGGFKRNAAIAWHIAPLPRVHADPALLRQVWFNLIDNAVKYSGKSPQPRIEIGGRTDDAAGVHEFFVRDNGAGFDMQYAAKLFGVFQRLHGTNEFEGTGIGLANVRRIIARHGGRTRAEGRVGEGAVFYFSLPAGAQPSPAPSFPASTSTSTSPPP